MTHRTTCICEQCIRAQRITRTDLLAAVGIGSLVVLGCQLFWYIISHV